MELLFLGTGTSYGVPVIGCKCEVCTSGNPKNVRCRPTALLSVGKVRILIDACPELRVQCLKYGVDRVDAVLLTHAHADHIFGLDDLRAFNNLRGGPIDVYANGSTVAELKRRFDYVFKPTQIGGGIPLLNLHEAAGEFNVLGVTVTPVPALHGRLPVLGYRIGPLAYLTDVSALPDESAALLEGLDVLVIGALRYRPHPTHFNIEQSLAVRRKLMPRTCYFTHLTHNVDHDRLQAELPEGVFAAFDGLTISTED